MGETWQGDVYCVKCKEKKAVTAQIHVAENGRRSAKGQCPVCSTNLTRFLPKA